MLVLCTHILYFTLIVDSQNFGLYQFFLYNKILSEIYKMLEYNVMLQQCSWVFLPSYGFWEMLTMEIVHSKFAEFQRKMSSLGLIVYSFP